MTEPTQQPPPLMSGLQHAVGARRLRLSTSLLQIKPLQLAQGLKEVRGETDASSSTPVQGGTVVTYKSVASQHVACGGYDVRCPNVAIRHNARSRMAVS